MSFLILIIFLPRLDNRRTCSLRPPRPRGLGLSNNRVRQDWLHWPFSRQWSCFPLPVARLLSRTWGAALLLHRPGTRCLRRTPHNWLPVHHAQQDGLEALEKSLRRVGFYSCHDLGIQPRSRKHIQHDGLHHVRFPVRMDRPKLVHPFSLHPRLQSFY